MESKLVLNSIGRAIKVLDEYAFSINENTVGSKDNVNRISESRKNLINVLFSCGYELNHETYRVIKSKQKRDML